jgi:hypothetical protein
MKNYLILTLFASSISFRIHAQGGGQNKERIESLKIAFITRKVGLTAEEARLFWPIFNAFEAEQESLRKKHNKEKMAILDELSDASDAEIEKLVDGEIIFRQQELDIFKKYHPQFKKILPIKKVALLYRAQEEFQKELLKKLQERSRE